MKQVMDDAQPVVKTYEEFDRSSGIWLERLLFNNRGVILVLCALVTAALGYQATHLRVNASFEKMLPVSHPYIANFLENREQLPGQVNSVRIVVEAKNGTIFSKEYMEVLRRINDEVFLIPGVDRPFMKSLWTPATRWIAVTEEGLDGGTVMPDNYDGTAASLDRIRENIQRSGELGRLVASDFKSSVVVVPLLETVSGQPLDYKSLSEALEDVRGRYESDTTTVRITGFAQVIGELIKGIYEVLLFFAIAIAFTTVIVYWHTRSLRSTLLVVVCSLVAVIWLLGMLPSIGFVLNPYSVLVPFLVFAIGMSHGAQKMNGIMQDVGRGTHRIVAARYTFRRLFLAGVTALLADAFAFAVLMVIDIPVIRELAVTASIGVGILIFTNLVLLPILLSYTGVGAKAAARSLRQTAGLEAGARGYWKFLDHFTEKKWATITVAVAVLLGAGGFAVSTHLRIGDLDPGAPELRSTSRYNRDDAYVVEHYAASTDQFIVMIRTPQGRCVDYANLYPVEQLEVTLQQLPGVEGTSSFVGLAKITSAGFSEGNLKWYELSRNQGTINTVATQAPRELFSGQCDMLPLYVYLRDHKADTLERVVNTVETFAKANDTTERHFLLAAGNAGVEAATNIVVKRSNVQMLVLVYLSVIILCFITFRSWRAVLCAVLPLMLTSILCEALMVVLGIGVKVATLPVIALGVGIGVDYALYILSVTLNWLRRGESLTVAYDKTMGFTGKVVVLTGMTLAIGVATWAFSPIKFQADMGILLAFMFVWNMIGALLLSPALCYFLLRNEGARRSVAKGESK